MFTGWEKKNPVQEELLLAPHRSHREVIVVDGGRTKVKG